MLLAPSLRSQPRIWLKTGAIDTGNGRGDLRVRSGSRSLRGRRHWIVQFRSYPGAGLRAELARRGIRVLEYVPDLALMVSAPGTPDLGDLDVRWAGALTPAEKISPLVRGGQYDAFVVSFQLDADLEKARETVRREGFEVVENEGPAPRHLLHRRAAGPVGSSGGR